MSVTDRIDGRTAAVGAGAGVAAYLVGYLITYVTHRDTMDERLEWWNALLELGQNDPVAGWQSVGWLFYNAHFVDTLAPGFGGRRVVSFIGESDPGASTLLYVVPALLLLLAGVAIVTLARTEEPLEGAVVGALPVLGYLPAAAVGVAVFTYTAGDSSVHPDWVTAILLAGLVYPLAFGGIGGALGTFVADRG